MSGVVLVTGGAGYIGSHVSKALAEAGLIPVCYDTLEKGTPGRSGGGRSNAGTSAVLTGSRRYSPSTSRAPSSIWPAISRSASPCAARSAICKTTPRTARF